MRKLLLLFLLLPLNACSNTNKGSEDNTSDDVEVVSPVRSSSTPSYNIAPKYRDKETGYLKDMFDTDRTSDDEEVHNY